MKRVTLLALLGALLATAACTGDPSSGSSPSAGGPPVDSAEAFTAYSGFALPATASGVTIQATSAYDATAYRARFSLPSADLDAFCRSGRMSRPLRIITISPEQRQTFDYDGDSSTGVAYGKAALPSNVRVQREVFAVGTKTKTAQVQVYAYTLPS